MVLKRILSCLAMISIVFIVSCYDVSYDKDENTVNATTGNWWDGLNTEQKIKAMMITGETIAVNKANTRFYVSWDYPDKITNPCFWELESLKIKIGDSIPDFNNDSLWTALPDVTITAKETSDGCWNYSFIESEDINEDEYLVYYRITMNDNNGNEYKNIISFVVFPDAWTISVYSAESDAAINSWLYFKTPIPEEGRKVFNNPVKDYVSGTISDTGEVFTITAYSPVVFKIKSDFSSRGLGLIYHYSNSSYCKVVPIVSTANEIKLRYSFEDLPITQVKYEPYKEFDYDDVIFDVVLTK